MVIAFEGVDSSGKATQTKSLAQYLGCDIISFPSYDTITGRAILGNLKEDWDVRLREDSLPRFEKMDDLRAHLQRREEMKKHLNALVLQSLMTVNRLEVLPKLVDSAVNGRHVILDRYYASGLVYGAMDGLPMEFLESIHRMLPQPDMWVLLDVSVDESIRRRPERRDRYEARRDFLEQVRAGYLQLFDERRKRGERWLTINAHGPASAVATRIEEAVVPLFQKPPRPPLLPL